MAVLGAGAWGTAIARHLAQAGHEVGLWARRREAAEALLTQRVNPLLPGIELPPEVSVHWELGPATAGAELLVLAVPCHGLRTVLEALGAAGRASGRVYVSAAKGIENGGLRLPTEIVEDVLGPGCPSVALSGPSFAQEVGLSMPTSVVAASSSLPLAERVQVAFSFGSFRVYTSDDPVGVQVAGALKNVVAIAVGASDGLGLGSNARAALVTRALSEVGRLAASRGGMAHTVSGLAGLGDLVLTCTGELSRNRRVGLELGRGRTLPQALKVIGHVAEGVTTAQSAWDLANQLGLDLPICREVWRVLYDGKTARAAVEDLQRRPLKRE